MQCLPAFLQGTQGAQSFHMHERSAALADPPEHGFNMWGWEDEDRAGAFGSFFRLLWSLAPTYKLGYTWVITV